VSSLTGAPADAITSLVGAHIGRRFPYLLDAGTSTRCSYAGSDPVDQLVVRRDGTSLRWRGNAWLRIEEDPIETIGSFVDENEADARVLRGPGLPTSGIPARVVGYLAYELGAWIEGVHPVAADPVGAPLAVLSVYDRVDVLDPASGELTALKFVPRLAGRRTDLPVPAGGPALEPSLPWANLQTLGDQRERYRDGFDRIQRAISAGEIYQANLTRSILRSFAGRPIDGYRKLRARQVVPYGAFLDLGTFAILSNSPECFLEIRGREISTYPIKGTRARSRNPNDDADAIASLTRDPKELAEHVMIVDLERNDLGRISFIGSVTVPEHARLLSLATVHHLVSRVTGRLRDDVGTADILRAAFPSGSITGAPKIQAMRTISEVEPTARGIYTGAIGAFNGPRCAELNVAIRTAVVTGGRVVYGTGGGIVADSRLESEYEETVTKSRAFLDSLGEIGIVEGRDPGS
jgi:para-aminobenzoate synthetase component 1